jgi:hypothetical protein
MRPTSVAQKMLLTLQEDGIMVINTADVPSVEEILAIAYHCIVVKGQLGESVAGGGSSESNNTVDNRKIRSSGYTCNNERS